MRCVVLGASGGCGQHLVTQAIERDWSVLAVARPSSDLAALPQQGVETERGDLTDPTFLSACFEGAHVVVSGLGPKVKGLAPWNKTEVPDFPAKSAQAVVEAAKQAGVRRIVAVSAGGVGDSFDALPGFFQAMIKTTAMKTAYRELEDMEAVYLQSGLDVVMARPTGLTDGPRTGNVVEAGGFKGRASISRADVAGQMLDYAEAESIENRTPMITVTGAA